MPHGLQQFLKLKTKNAKIYVLKFIAYIFDGFFIKGLKISSKYMRTLLDTR